MTMHYNFFSFCYELDFVVFVRIENHIGMSTESTETPTITWTIPGLPSMVQEKNQNRHLPPKSNNLSTHFFLDNFHRKTKSCW